MRSSIHSVGRAGALTLSALALAATTALTGAPAGAHDGDHSTSEATSAAPESLCSPAEKKRLKAAGDRFASACQPGADFVDLDDSRASLEPGETASSPNLKLVANLPKQGGFGDIEALNSDLAFKGNYAFAGNYNGFMVYDISTPTEPKVVTQVVCPGAQNDVSVVGNLLVLSVDESRNNDSCESTYQAETEKSSWEGIRVFDITDPAKPRYAAGVETDCGSHTHSLAPSKDGKTVYVYVSSYFPSKSSPDCQPPHDKISIVKIPVDSPDDASLAGTPSLFPDGGNPGNNGSTATSGCHDITAYPSKDIAAGACMGDGILMDISDREHPVVTQRVRDTKNFAFWHSATFNNAGTKVVFTDELGGGGAPTCNPTTGQQKGADGIYNIQKGKLVFKSYFKIPRTQANTENCVAHNGSLIPVKGRDIMVQAWYQGGISVWDFTNSAKPVEIAWFDRGPFDPDALSAAGAWSTYYYNGFIYSNEIQRGFDVFELKDPLTDSARDVKMDVFNPQSQPSYNG